MYQVTVRQITPFQVDFPKTVIERTRKGSFHFRPGTAVLLTGDEYEFLKKDKTNCARFIFQGEVKETLKKKVVEVPKPKVEKIEIVQPVEVPKPFKAKSKKKR